MILCEVISYFRDPWRLSSVFRLLMHMPTSTEFKKRVRKRLLGVAFLLTNVFLIISTNEQWRISIPLLKLSSSWGVRLMHHKDGGNGGANKPPVIIAGFNCLTVDTHSISLHKWGKNIYQIHYKGINLHLSQEYESVRLSWLWNKYHLRWQDPAVSFQTDSLRWFEHIQEPYEMAPKDDWPLSCSMMQWDSMWSMARGQYWFGNATWQPTVLH
jgi:hypothetical protein